MERQDTSGWDKDWDKYYYNICLDVMDNSKCFSRQIGAILVKDKCIISTGFNGPPRGAPRCDLRQEIPEEYRKLGTCPRTLMGFKSGQGLDWCTAAHGEENAILMCARMGIEAKEATMYMSCGIPCKNCMIKIINVGIKEIVVTSMDLYDETSGHLLKGSPVKARLYSFLE